MSVRNGKRRIVIGEKLMNDRRIKLIVKNEPITEDIEWWISNHPRKIYYHVYEANKHGIKRISLTSVGILLLKEELKLTAPELLEEINTRKAMRKAHKMAGILYRRH